MRRLSPAPGSFAISPSCADGEKVISLQSRKRTAARASLKVGAEGRFGLGIPSRGAWSDGRLRRDFVGPQRDQGEQPEQRRGGASDRWIRPLPLGLDAQVTADLGEGHLDRPPSKKPAQHHERIGLQVGAQEALRLERTVHVAHENPADWNLLAEARPLGGAVGIHSPLPSGERVARRAGEGGAWRYVRQKRTPLTLTLSPERRGDFKCDHPGGRCHGP